MAARTVASVEKDGTALETIPPRKHLAVKAWIGEGGMKTMADSELEFHQSHRRGGSDRRGFLRRLGGGGLVAAAASWSAATRSSGAQAAQRTPSKKTPLLPTIKIGAKTITRLIAGSNPVQGYSHSTQNLARHMMEYFTVERTAGFLMHCEEVGVNTFQASYSDKVRDALRLAWERGSKIQWICLTSDAPGHAPLEKALPLKPIAVVHHGVTTDNLFREGKADTVHDYVKKVHGLGLLAGVSTHNPKNVWAAEEAGWENDFFMTCFYNVVRTDEEIKRELGAVPLGELFLPDDPKAMIETIRQSRKPCLGFKILAAGRLCWNPYSVQQAFAFAFRNIKPSDGVIVGMYPRFKDEPQENALLTRKYSTGT